MALDFAAGCLGGCAGVVVGHPLDTVKVLLQTQDCKNPQYRGSIDCFKSIIAREGVRGLFKGISSPLAGVAGINAVVFGVYGNTQRNMNNPNSLYSHAFAGGAAGLCQSFICSPMELAKLRLQVSSDTKLKALDCLKTIYEAYGVKGVFRGITLTISREVPSFAAYFLTYEALTGCGKEPVSTVDMLIAGGLAGCASWTITYPVDVLKSRFQIDNHKYSSSLDCLKQTIKTEGISPLFRGLTPTIIRAFPVNAVTFTVVTWILRICGDDGWKQVKEACSNTSIIITPPLNL